MGGIAAPWRIEVRPDFRVRGVVLEDLRARTVSFISDPHHSPTQVVGLFHLPPSHSASKISSCQAEQAAAGCIGLICSHPLSVANVLRL